MAGQRNGNDVLFADTFYWVALFDRFDSAHNRALALTAERKSSHIVTTDEVLAECLNFFSGRPEVLRSAVAEKARDFLSDPAIDVIPQSRNSFRAGLELYIRRPDKGYSLTDCISMEAMRREGLTEVLTDDHHFEQEGFRALFREPWTY
ncbi:MAG TPA: PIN domain-containing protein [Terriglobia bacterium]|nr:PIN domain-containing protein [Terriglobia bacterium]